MNITVMMMMMMMTMRLIKMSRWVPYSEEVAGVEVGSEMESYQSSRCGTQGNLSGAITMTSPSLLTVDFILFFIYAWLFPTGYFCEQPNFWLDHPPWADGGRLTHRGDQILHNHPFGAFIVSPISSSSSITLTTTTTIITIIIVIIIIR